MPLETAESEVIWTRMPPRLCWVSQRALKTYTALSAWVTVGAGAVSMTRKQGREEGESLHGWVQLSLGCALCTSFCLIPQVMDFPLLARGWAVTGGNQVPFCLPPSPSACRPLPQWAVALWRFSWRRGHSYVIVMQRGSAAWDDVNGTAFANEKLSWHLLKDKAPTLGRCSIFLFTMLVSEMVFDQEMTHW